MLSTLFLTFVHFCSFVLSVFIWVSFTHSCFREHYNYFLSYHNSHSQIMFSLFAHTLILAVFVVFKDSGQFFRQNLSVRRKMFCRKRGRVEMFALKECFQYSVCLKTLFEAHLCVFHTLLFSLNKVSLRVFWN